MENTKKHEFQNGMVGQSVLVTGGASGIGRAVVLRLARSGARVVIGDISDNAPRVAEEARNEGLDVEAIHLDVTSPESVAAAKTWISDRYNLTGLVNGAGWSHIQKFQNNAPDLWKKTIDLNLVGPIQLTHSFIPHILATPGFRIVNISSDAGRVGSAGEAVYSAAKAGLTAFTKALAREMARAGVMVNCVCPGPIDTPLWQAQPERFRELAQAAVPMRRVGRPEEVAEAVWFFARPQTTFITGQVLSVNGGLFMSD